MNVLKDSFFPDRTHSPSVCERLAALTFPDVEVCRFGSRARNKDHLKRANTAIHCLFEEVLVCKEGASRILCICLLEDLITERRVRTVGVPPDH